MCEAVTVGSALLFIAVVAVCVLMLWASYKMEPHWVSKDGERMICYGQGLSRNGISEGRWRELRVSKVRHDTVEVKPRRGSLAVSRPTGAAASNLLRRRMPKSSYWKVVGQTETPIRNRVMYILDGNNDEGLPDMIAVRLPAKSKAIAMLESMSTNRTPSRTTPRSNTTTATATTANATTSAHPGMPRSADPPVPD